jgi:hypothetical protein
MLNDLTSFIMTCMLDAYRQQCVGLLDEAAVAVRCSIRIRSLCKPRAAGYSDPCGRVASGNLRYAEQLARLESESGIAGGDEKGRSLTPHYGEDTALHRQGGRMASYKCF